MQNDKIIKDVRFAVNQRSKIRIYLLKWTNTITIKINNWNTGSSELDMKINSVSLVQINIWVDC